MLTAELDLAARTASQSALASLDQIAARLAVEDTVTAEVRAELAEHHPRWASGANGDNDSDDESVHERQYRDLKLEVLAHKRATTVALRDRQLIDDTVLRQIRSRLDLEEIRLRGPTDTE